MAVVTRFVDNDQAYLAWVGSHPLGFVLNCERRPQASYLMLHRASCGTISTRRAGQRSWTADYIKICSLDPTELIGWARRETGADVSRCGLCNP